MVEITVFTGFLGSGKTSLILNLLPQVPKDYKLAILKNEFGDNAIDSKLFEQLNKRQNISTGDGEVNGGTGKHMAVKEMLNGCLCCVLVGQMKNALLEIQELYQPDRIIIETSGSAFPAPIAWQVRELKPDGFNLDSILTVIDCVNFKGYEDTSYTAKLQAQYTDLLLLNKVELVNERELDLVIDHVAELNPDTPRIICHKDQPVSLDLIFGLDTPLFKTKTEELHHDEHHHQNEVDIIQINVPKTSSLPLLTKSQWEEFLKKLNSEDVFRVKGIVHLSEDPNAAKILNWAFGRWEWFDYDNENDKFVELTVMGQLTKRYITIFNNGLGIDNSLEFITYHPTHQH